MSKPGADHEFERLDRGVDQDRRSDEVVPGTWLLVSGPGRAGPTLPGKLACLGQSSGSRAPSSASGARPDHAVDRRLVEALGQHSAVRDNRCRALPQPAQDAAPRVGEHRGIDQCRRGDPASLETRQLRAFATATVGVKTDALRPSACST